MIRNNLFYLVLSLICVLSLFIRFINYDITPPINEAFDEVYYAWGGVSWIKEGVPKSWSWFDDYRNYTFINQYGIQWRIVWPVIEKPPLYFLLSGFSLVVMGFNNYQIPHSAIRILPLILSISTIYLTGILSSKVFNRKVGLISAALYGVLPTIVLANRMSLTENLLTPFVLLSAILLVKERKLKNKYNTTILIGVLSFLSILTKQIGAAVALWVILIYFLQKEWKKLYIGVVSGIIAVVTYLIFAAYYDLELFIKLQQRWRIAHTLSSLPEVITNIFRFPVIAAKNHPFVDGTIFLGYILLFSSPLWIRINFKKYFSLGILLTFPFIYLLLLTIGESGAGAFTFFGWYLYPLFPFLVILCAKIFYDFWQKPKVSIAALLLLFVGTSLVRFAFLNLPRDFHYLWQYSYIFLVLITFAIFLPYKKFSKVIMISLFIIFLIVNIVTDLNLPSIYENVALNDTSLSGFNR